MPTVSDINHSVPSSRLFVRAAWLLGMLVLGYLGLAGRLVQLQYVEHKGFAEVSRRQMEAEMRWTPWRGTLVDATGRPLAVSVQVHSCAIDPKIVREQGLGVNETVQLLADALRLAPVEVQQIHERSAHRWTDSQGVEREPRFVWVRRHLATEDYDAVQKAIQARNEACAEADLPRVGGVVFPLEYDRRYPQGDLAAHVLGFTNIDGVGQEGVERMADAFLRGVEDDRRVQRDARRRRLVEDGSEVDIDRTGLTVELSLDVALQLIVEEELDKVMEQYTPSTACAIVMDPYTGDILALANRPAFDPNHPAAQATANRFNHAIASIVEPGSTFKPFVFARALQDGTISLSTPIHCENGAWRMANGRVLHDSHPYGLLSAEMVLVKSSNIGMAKIALMMGERHLYNTVCRFGFGKETGIPLIGEQDGMIHPLSRWTSYSMGSVPMGQEVAVTPLQLAAAYCVLANGGTLVRPRIVKSVLNHKGDVVYDFPVIVRRSDVLAPETAAKVRRVLRKVVTDGTGRRLKMNDYQVAGKTGTAQLPVNSEELRAGQRGYSEDRYVATFVGIAPYDVPRIVVLVSVREPHGEHYGGVVAGPVVREISRKALMYLGEPPVARQARQGNL